MSDLATRRGGALAAIATGLPLLVAWAPAGHAAPAPLWEIGLGVGAVAFEDYRGADRAHVYPLPAVYFLYRGEFLRSDRDGVRGLLFNSTRVELNVSVNATTPVKSSVDDARAGMPDLKPTFEVGPSLDVHLWRSADRRLKLDLRLPVRRVITIEHKPHAIGWFFAPRLNLDIRDVGGHDGWNLGFLAGPLFGNRAYHTYFYTVEPEFATPVRPEYRASGGYSGAESIAAVSRRFPHFWVGAFVRYDVLAGAAFLDSPLVRRNSYWAGGIALAWMVGKSTRFVETSDGE